MSYFPRDKKSTEKKDPAKRLPRTPTKGKSKKTGRGTLKRRSHPMR